MLQTRVQRSSAKTVGTCCVQAGLRRQCSSDEVSSWWAGISTVPSLRSSAWNSALMSTLCSIRRSGRGHPGLSLMYVGTNHFVNTGEGSGSPGSEIVYGWWSSASLCIRDHCLSISSETLLRICSRRAYQLVSHLVLPVVSTSGSIRSIWSCPHARRSRPMGQRLRRRSEASTRVSSRSLLQPQSGHSFLLRGV